MFVDIRDLPDSPTVNGITFFKLPAQEHKRMIAEHTPSYYRRIPGWVVIGRGKNDWTLRIKRTADGAEEEKEVLDFLAMYTVLSAGVLNERMAKVLIEFLKQKHAPAVPHTIDHLFHAPALEAVRKFTGMDMVIMKSGGAEAVETAVNIAFQYWVQRNKEKYENADGSLPYIIAAKNNFHGRTLLARSLSSNDIVRKTCGPVVHNVIHVPFNDVPSIGKAFEAHAGEIAAIILEPIQGTAGVRVPDEEYLSAVRSLCDKNDAVFILDEIHTGFGVIGADFACELYGVTPDLLCAGKAAGAGIIPVSFVAGKREIMSAVKPGTEGATWSAAPIQCLALLLAIQELSDKKLSEQAARKGAYARTLFERLQKKIPEVITGVRGKGLLMGIDTIYEGKRVADALLEEGLWVKEGGAGGKTIRLSPPLTVPEEDIERAVALFEKALARLG
ncbi:MAG: Ornithine aminotransferase [Parcubacteria group bacterium GW2011_GWA2_47_7]|nr:MAG: Ornithine aminotransferase [Parcubacteria group bacterium GW2011_GWA2_47_7]